MVYLDANVFIFAALAKDELGEASRRVLTNLGRFKARTCCLAIDELAWVALRHSDNLTAVNACRAVLSLKDLEIASVDYGDAWEMTKGMEEIGLRPRDALHLAVMKRLGEKEIVTEDQHFDRTRVKRFSIGRFAELHGLAS